MNPEDVLDRKIAFKAVAVDFSVHIDHDQVVRDLRPSGRHTWTLVTQEDEKDFRYRCWMASLTLWQFEKLLDDRGLWYESAYDDHGYLRFQHDEMVVEVIPIFAGLRGDWEPLLRDTEWYTLHPTAQQPFIWPTEDEMRRADRRLWARIVTDFEERFELVE